MLYKVSDLDGALLDAAVAKANGAPLIDVATLARLGDMPERRSPSTRWEDGGGAIIERWRIERLTIERQDDGSGWSVLAVTRTASVVCADGPTQLIALVRAWLLDQVGEEVELP
jgi:hypothetical protein